MEGNLCTVYGLVGMQAASAANMNTNLCAVRFLSSDIPVIIESTNSNTKD